LAPMSEDYHRFVFDSGRRRFVGQFEEMYRREDVEGYDSWHQENLDTLARRVSIAMLADRAYPRILDVGCGKGAFTSLLKTETNHVVGIDVSSTAIAKAAERYPGIDFRVLPTERLGELAGELFDLACAMEVLSYLRDWRDTIKTIARLASRLFVTLYLPPDPIGFVKSFDELRDEVSRSFAIEAEALLNREQLLIVAYAA
jgi:SAM-dependent methyltransferase